MYRISSITADSQNMSSAVGIACLFLQRDLTFILISETKKRWGKKRRRGNYKFTEKKINLQWATKWSWVKQFLTIKMLIGTLQVFLAFFRKIKFTIKTVIKRHYLLKNSNGDTMQEILYLNLELGTVLNCWYKLVNHKHAGETYNQKGLTLGKRVDPPNS